MMLEDAINTGKPFRKMGYVNWYPSKPSATVNQVYFTYDDVVNGNWEVEDTSRDLRESQVVSALKESGAGAYIPTVLKKLGF